MCEKSKISQVFQDIPAPRRNNGEVFLFQYGQEQKKRNEQLNDVRDQVTKRCNCAQCIRLVYPLIGALPTTKCDCGYRPPSGGIDNDRPTVEFPRTNNHIIPAQRQQSHADCSSETRIDVVMEPVIRVPQL